MAARYYSEAPIDGPTATLSGNEAHHLLHVMRARPGDEITVFDGRGGEFKAEITRCGRAEVKLSVGHREDIERELPFELTLAVALPKGDRQRWLVEKAVELGVSKLVPLLSARCQKSQSEPAAKLQRYVVEASKQCGRNRLLEITAPVGFTELMPWEAERRLLAHPSGEPFSSTATLDRSTLLAIGPEGGFTDQEVAAAVEASWTIVGLGVRILRVETAALALLARVGSCSG